MYAKNYKNIRNGTPRILIGEYYMKVLQINTVCGKSSTGRIATDIADLLEQQGHECKIAYGRGDVLEQYKKYAVKIALFENDLNGLYPVQAVAEYTENAAG